MTPIITQDRDYDSGYLGWVLGSAGVVLAILAMAAAGAEVPDWMADLSGLLDQSDADIPGKNASFRAALLLLFSWTIAGFAPGGLVLWLANRWPSDRLRGGLFRSRRERRRSDPVYVIAEVAGAAVSVVFFVAFGLAGGSWGLVAASILLLVVLAIVLQLGMDRLRRLLGAR